MAMQMNKKIVLENGKVFAGFGFGADCDRICQLVFNTSMVGYQEIVSDPGYIGQMVVMTYPIIGSYGVNDEDDESRNPQIGGLIVRDYNDLPSTFRDTKTLSEAMEEDGIPGISGIDTRELTRILRSEGIQKVMLTSIDTPTEQALAAIAAWEPDRDVVRKITCKKRWYSRTPNHRYNVVAVDCGIRLSTVKALNALGCNVTVVPCTTTLEQVASLQADGLYISDGPGDPANVPEVVELIRNIQGRWPIFGTGLGHELICLACGGTIEAMKAGHQGSNHPVRNLNTGKIKMYNQSHRYVLSSENLEGTGLRITHVNVLDGTAEAAECVDKNIFSAQFNPDKDDEMYARFLKLMEEGRKNNA